MLEQNRLEGGCRHYYIDASPIIPLRIRTRAAYPLAFHRLLKVWRFGCLGALSLVQLRLTPIRLLLIRNDTGTYLLQFSTATVPASVRSTSTPVHLCSSLPAHLVCVYRYVCE